MIGLISRYTIAGQTLPDENVTRKQCAQIRPMKVYSDATYIEEAGDVTGYELALAPGSALGITGRLYIYEGTPNLDGIPISGMLKDKQLHLMGEEL